MARRPALWVGTRAAGWSPRRPPPPSRGAAVILDRGVPGKLTQREHRARRPADVGLAGVPVPAGRGSWPTAGRTAGSGPACCRCRLRTARSPPLSRAQSVWSCRMRSAAVASSARCTARLRWANISWPKPLAVATASAPGAAGVTTPRFAADATASGGRRPRGRTGQRPRCRSATTFRGGSRSGSR